MVNTQGLWSQTLLYGKPIITEERGELKAITLALSVYIDREATSRPDLCQRSDGVR